MNVDFLWNLFFHSSYGEKRMTKNVKGGDRLDRHCNFPTEYAMKINFMWSNSVLSKSKSDCSRMPHGIYKDGGE